MDLDSKIIRSVTRARDEAEDEREFRMRQNRVNYNVYHQRGDYSHKKAGQSKEFLAKQSMAVEQLTSFLAQGLIDVGKWFEVKPAAGKKIDGEIIDAVVIQKLLSRQLEKNNIVDFVSDSIKTGALASLMICKVHGQIKTQNDYELESDDFGGDKVIRAEKDVWELKLDLIRPEDFFPDPTGEGLYEVQRIEMDHHKLVELAKANPKDYDLEAIQSLGSNVDQEQRRKRKEETGQDALSPELFRRRVEILEYWGDILDPDTGEVIMKNAVCAIANDSVVISKPRRNPFWHGKSPFVCAPILRVPHSVWHKAIMDAPTSHNLALNEIYNLIIDSGMMSTFGIKQLRESWLDDPSQVNNGITPGDTLVVNTSCPPGAKVLERVDTANTSQEAVSVFAMTEKEFQQSSLTNDLRMGVLPERNVKATEIVAQNQSLTGMFQGIVKQIEARYMSQFLERAWMVIAQNMDDLDDDEVIAMLGEDLAKQIEQLSPQERFVATAKGNKFRVFGLSSILNKVQDFRKVTGLLQTIASSPLLMQEFQRKYSFTKLLGEIVNSLDIDEDKISNDDQDRAAQDQQNEQISGLASALNAVPDAQSQVPDAAKPEAELGVVRGDVSRAQTNPLG